MWPQRAIRLMLLLLSCNVMLLNQVAEGLGMDRTQNSDCPRPDQTDCGENEPRASELEDERFAPQATAIDDVERNNFKNNTHRCDRETESDINSPSWAGTCSGLVEKVQSIRRDLFDALAVGWGGDSKPEEAYGARFGLCPETDGIIDSNGLNSVLSALANGAEKDGDGLYILRPMRELWGEDGMHQNREVTLHFLLPPSLAPQLGRLTPVLAFFLGVSSSAGRINVSFTSQSLHPHQQTACISTGTKYAVLTMRHLKVRTHSHLVLRITVEMKQEEEEEKKDLPDLLTGKRAGHNDTRGPLLLLQRRVLNSSNSSGNGSTPEMGPSPNPQVPSRTFLFLCILQKFLSEALFSEKLDSSPAQAASVFLDSLQSLPPLSLGASSSESLLLGFLNSSAPTIFSFPIRATELLGQRVELDLQPSLITVLRLQLEEAVTRLAREETGRRSLRDQLQRLQELSSLPEESGGVLADVESHREAQYRAVLLLKALQTVLGAWEDERSVRSARAGEEGSGRGGTTCRLQPLTVLLKNYVLNPTTAAINNCEGACGFPLADANNHAILLNAHEQSGLPLGRSLCCVPLEYEDLQVVELKEAGTEISIKPDMVAKKCGCR